MDVTRTLMTSILILGCAAGAMAQQQPPPTPPPVEQRMFGAPPTFPRSAQGEEELTPEESTTLEKMTGSKKLSWSEFMVEWMKPRETPKSTVVWIDDTYAYPHIAVSFKMRRCDPPEGVEPNDDVVWLCGIPPEDPESPLHKMWEDHQAREMFYKAQRAWEEEHGEDEHFLDFDSEPLPPPFMDGLRFEAVQSAVPDRGRWQMSFDLADMNGDGVDDLVFPPSRKGTPKPAILLGLGDGRFKFWKDVTWPADIPFDYGGVTTADFDGDGHRDFAIAIHFKGQYVMYGDGQGHFERGRLLPSPDVRLSSRAPVAADFDGDGRVDLAFVAEIDYDLATSARLKGTPTVWVTLNRPDRWVVQPGFIGGGVIADNILAADVNGDGRQDIVVASNASNYRKLVFLNKGDGKWEEAPHRGVLSAAYHADVAVTSKEPGALYATFVQFLLTPSKENLARTGVVRYQAAGADMEQRGVALVADDQRFDPYFRLAAGDLNGDGKTDVVAARKGGEVQVFVQTPTGQFYQEQSPEIAGDRGTPFDIRLADLNGDGNDDLIVMSADTDEAIGGVRVWLSKPVS